MNDEKERKEREEEEANVMEGTLQKGMKRKSDWDWKRN
jgi:hypothetical protein